MTATTKAWLRALAILLALVLIWRFAGSLIAALLGGTIAVSAFLANVLLPAASVFVLGWFGYSVFLKKYLRAWRINRIREGRYLKEVMDRSRKE